MERPVSDNVPFCSSLAPKPRPHKVEVYNLCLVPASYLLKKFKNFLSLRVWKIF